MELNYDAAIAILLDNFNKSGFMGIKSPVHMSSSITTIKNHGITASVDILEYIITKELSPLKSLISFMEYNSYINYRNIYEGNNKKNINMLDSHKMQMLCFKYCLPLTLETYEHVTTYYDQYRYLDHIYAPNKIAYGIWNFYNTN